MQLEQILFVMQAYQMKEFAESDLFCAVHFMKSPLRRMLLKFRLKNYLLINSFLVLKIEIHPFKSFSSVPYHQDLCNPL